MKYTDTSEAVFLERPNRFEAVVMTEGGRITVHVKNTGRCLELLVPGARVTLQRSQSPKRKTGFDLISVYKERVGWINIDSQAPNKAVAEWLSKTPAPFSDLTLVKPEYVFGGSRIDFYIESPGRKILLEVKGCTLEKERTGYFPDAPTSRRRKHLFELIKAKDEGFECFLAFVIAVPGVTECLANVSADPDFASALLEAEKAGVRILRLPCAVGPSFLEIIT